MDKGFNYLGLDGLPVQYYKYVFKKIPKIVYLFVSDDSATH